MKGKKTRLYGVKLLKEVLGVEFSGAKTELKLSWADGQVGAIPVFDNLEDAMKYADYKEEVIFILELKDER